MIDRIRKNLDKGLDQVKWIATFLAERTRAETEIAKLLFEATKIEGKIDDLYLEIGKRVVELKEKGDRAILKDFIILKAFDEIRHLRISVEEYRNQANNLSKLPE